MRHVLTVVLGACLLLWACHEPAATPEPVSTSQEGAPAPGVDAAPVAVPEPAMVSPCTRLITCCDAWVVTNPGARVGCDAHRDALSAAKTPDAREALESGCAQALSAWGGLPDLPEVCRP